ncbi:MAG: lysoplasmalogenase [Anaeroplasmataceae bacterium]|nr:lysoplasmalogenase [Anaeroplasmataceae bacterium]MDE6414360.1 lysoplasmalogenase [Anaeroplasmataceae bacterium]
MKKYIFEIIGVFLALLVLIGDVLYILYGGLWLKGITSALFFLLGIHFLILAFLRKKRIHFPVFMVIGLALTMIADIVLNIHFIAGAILFALGHIFYAISYYRLKRWHWLDLVCSCLLAIPAVLWISLAPMFDFGGVLMEIVVVFYAIIISFMVGKAISNFISNILKHQDYRVALIILIGSILFFFSDCMLLLNKFGAFSKDIREILTILCLGTYYPAQILLATSIRIYVQLDYLV